MSVESGSAVVVDSPIADTSAPLSAEADLAAVAGQDAINDAAPADEPVHDPQLAAFFGEKPAERETPAERTAKAPETTSPVEPVAPAETNHQAAEPEQPADEFDDETLALGAIQGYSPEDARAFPNAESFRRTLVANDRRALAQLQATAAPKTPEGQQPAAPAQPAPAPKVEDAAQAANALLEKFKLEFDPDVTDEQTAAKFMQWNDHLHGVLTQSFQKQQAAETALARLNQDVSMLISDRQRAHEERLIDEADRFFNAQTEFVSQLGKGTVAELKPGSPELAAREQIFTDAMQLQELDRKQGRAVGPSLDGYLKRALIVRNWDKSQELARQQVANQVAERKQSAVARPTQRRSPALSPETRALNRIRETMRSAGAPARDELATWQ
jgi:hypothetical protein